MNVTLNIKPQRVHSPRPLERRGVVALWPMNP
jgi:hypothetical protein